MMTRLVRASYGPRLRANTPAASVIAVALLLGLAPSAFSAEPQGTPGTKSKAISDKGVDRTLATSINFAKVLDLPFDSLASLGTRIEQATKIADPVCLASLAKELSVCEQVSEKTANLTSAMLFKEAVELAEARNRSAELKAVARFVNDHETAKKLGTLAKVAAKREDAERRAVESGERTRGINRNLYVHNNTGFTINVFEDGRQVGFVNPYLDSGPFYIGHGPSHNSVLNARSSDGTKVWPGTGSRIIDSNVLDWTWVLD